MIKATKESELRAGFAYCLVVIRYDYERNEDYDNYGACVYWDGYNFIYEDGDRCNDDWDYAIEQSSSPNPDYISGPQWTIVNGNAMDLKVWNAQCAQAFEARLAERAACKQ